MASKTGLNPRRRMSADIPLHFRLVLVGKTGSGKSSCGNTILGTDAFKSAVSQRSVTRECSKQAGEVYGYKVTLVDTPGLFDTFLPMETIEREISKCINMSAPGPHAILIVVKAGTFTAEEREAVKKVEKIFGKDCWRYTMMLFTHGDEVDKTDGGIEQCLKEAGEDLKDILAKMGNRYHVFNNTDASQREQVLQLLEKVKEMISANEGQEYYSNPTYLETVKMLDEREAQLKVLYKKKLEEETQTLVSKYERKLKESEQERETLEKRLNMEKEELSRYYRTLESGVRYVIEQVPGKDSSGKDSYEEILSKFHKTLKLN